ncbi:UDP-glucuronate:xylan alpha-glucuronosyltransferase 2-like [Durio zibethinus]|uniref:Hexosyltransferase n=1 Tax=Durio zibethinus TaxID=66656 RepID=A0A6P5ZIV7_DURZI|nr:UDP-glucuronate:xylan alpha-glucuronosyltransferase 2-like [Durio zibethinus]
MGEGLGLQKIIQATPSKSLVIRINLVFLALFLVIYASLLLRQSSSVYFENAASLVRCTLRECHHKMEAILENTEALKPKPKRNLTMLEVPTFIDEFGGGLKIGMVNFEDEDYSEWEKHGETIPVLFERVSELFEWKHLFPEWIDEEEEIDGPSCPEMPMPDFNKYDNMDLIVAKLPCKYPVDGWAREVFRLQVHLIAANLAVKNGKRDWNWRTKVVFLSKCRPMLEVFRCNDLVKQEGEWWYYEPEVARLEQKVSLPIGSCRLALPLWGRGNDEVFDVSKIERATRNAKREAYATMLHSSESYVCGAIALAQSLLKTGTNRDLILLLDGSISEAQRDALKAAGWQLRFIKRIRNPRAEKGSYNEYNYSKFRLWQLTDYDKVIFIDADIIVLRNLDPLFHFPQMTATGNDIWIFNSGIMVIEPSNCTFKLLMNKRKEIFSYNGGDQGFLNEVFVWWHRLPRRVNFLKNFWSNSTVEIGLKSQLFAADPPKLYAIHYLGLKPWRCYRDYDCNWNIGDQRVYASDAAHQRWWKFHDNMDEKLQKFCGLTKKRKNDLDWDRKKAREAGFKDEHWRIHITDPRRKNLMK